MHKNASNTGLLVCSLMKLMKLKDRIFHTETLVWTNTKVFKAFSIATVGFLCPLVLGFWTAFEEFLAPGKLSLGKHCLWQKCYGHFVRRRIWAHKNAVYSERIMNHLWASVGNCSLISDTNPCESLLLWWQCFRLSSAKPEFMLLKQGKCYLLEQTVQKFTQRQDFT